MKILFALLLCLIFFYEPIYSQQDQDPYLSFAQVMPQPVGGLAAIYKHIVYPQTARDARLEGKVYLLVYVDESGAVEKINVIKGLGLGCDEAAENAVKQVGFTPGTDKGQKVKVKVAIAINFKLGS